MDKSSPGESRRCKWSDSATNLLVSIWRHDLVQNQLKSSSRNQPIWESIARYMSRKGHPVTGLQCRTRIKNMLCSYHESVRKNDSSGIEPYYEVFKKVLEKNPSKKKDSKSSGVKEFTYSEEANEENEISLDSISFEVEQTQSMTDNDEYEVEFLDVSNEDSQNSLNSTSEINKFKNIVLKAIDMQTKAITNAVNMQSQMIEKLLIAERQKLEIILASERENRRQMEMRLDKLMSKFDVNIVPQVTYIGTFADADQNE